MTSIKDFLDRNNVLTDIKKFLEACTDMQDAWNKLKPDWLIWVATRTRVLTDKELRLFAVFCAKQVEHLMTDERSRNAIDVAERFANGQATAADLAAARKAAEAAVADLKAKEWVEDVKLHAIAWHAASAAIAAACDQDQNLWAESSQAARESAEAEALTYWAADAKTAQAEARAAQAAWLRANTKPDFSR